MGEYKLIAVMEGVVELNEGSPVELGRLGGKLVLMAQNEGGHNSTFVELSGLLAWIKANPNLIEG